MNKRRIFLKALGLTAFFAMMAGGVLAQTLGRTAETRERPAQTRNTPGQTRDKYVISAKAGGVNSVVGSVRVQRQGLNDDQLLTSQDDLAVGDVVNTGATGRVEVLLNPGSYFRAAENTEFQFVDTSSENLRLKVTKGTAIIEATGADESDLRIAVDVPQGHFAIVRGGLYRINIGATTELLVRKGSVELDGTPPQFANSGAEVLFSGNGLTVAKITKRQDDDFDNWSKERAANVAKANQKYPVSTLNGYLASYSGFNSGFGYSFWDRFNAYNNGFWAYNWDYNCYTFLPYRYGAWRSPYGRSYNPVRIFHGRLPWHPPTATSSGQSFGRSNSSVRSTSGSPSSGGVGRSPSSSRGNQPGPAREPSFGPARQPSFE
jgi:hypothetical protein